MISCELFEDLFGTQAALVGSIRRNKKKETVQELQADSYHSERSMIFCFDRQLILVSHIPKTAIRKRAIWKLIRFTIKKAMLS